MNRFQHLMFVCTNQRDASDPRGSCTARGSKELLDRLKELVHEHKLKGKVRIVGSGCLDLCAQGCTAVVFSAGKAESQLSETWCTKLKAEDADALFAKHIMENLEPAPGSSGSP